MKFQAKFAAALVGLFALGGVAFAAQSVYQTVSSLAGTELVELWGKGPLHLFATANQIGATAYSQGSTVTATASSGAATANGSRFAITSEALVTAAGSDYTLTLTNSAVTSASSIVLASAENGTNTTEGLAINRVQPASGSVVIHVRNTHASAALNGTIQINGIVDNKTTLHAFDGGCDVIGSEVSFQHPQGRSRSGLFGFGGCDR